MIYEIGQEVLTHLRAKGCSTFQLVDGPETTKSVTYGRERIVVEASDDGDTFGPVLGVKGNPRGVLSRLVGVKVTIYAQASNAGARPFEHRRRAEHVLDMVIVAFAHVCQQRGNRIAFVRGKFVQPTDIANSETRGGAAYELLLSIDRGVTDRSWEGEAAPEATLGEGGLTSTTHAYAQGTDPTITQTACGGS